MSKSSEKVKKKYADVYKWSDDEFELQSNLDYPDLDYPDFSIIRTFFLVPFFS